MIELKPEVDDVGNIIGLDIPEYNIIKEEDSIVVKTSKQDVQYKMYIGDKNEDA